MTSPQFIVNKGNLLQGHTSMDVAQLFSAGADCKLPAADELYALSASVVELGSASHKTVGTAESCTGGLVSGNLTAVPGSSLVVLGGITSYAISVKANVLGVSQSILNTVGAVSSECAQAMATGAKSVLKSDFAVSVTGIAGPGGEEPGKPVGTVWFGLATPSQTVSVRKQFSGTRSEVRAKAVKVALELLIYALDCE